MAFRVLIIGGTGQVGTAAVRALVSLPSCAEVVMVNRRETALMAGGRMRHVVLDTAGAGFQGEVAALARSIAALGDPVYGASCVGVGKGSAKWTEEELKALELGVVGGARGPAVMGVWNGSRCCRQSGVVRRARYQQANFQSPFDTSDGGNTLILFTNARNCIAARRPDGEGVKCERGAADGQLPHYGCALIDAEES